MIYDPPHSRFCRFCEEPFLIRDSQHNRQVFCSWDCRWRAQRQRMWERKQAAKAAAAAK